MFVKFQIHASAYTIENQWIENFCPWTFTVQVRCIVGIDDTSFEIIVFTVSFRTHTINDIIKRGRFHARRYRVWNVIN